MPPAIALDIADRLGRAVASRRRNQW